MNSVNYVTSAFIFSLATLTHGTSFLPHGSSFAKDAGNRKRTKSYEEDDSPAREASLEEDEDLLQAR